MSRSRLVMIGAVVSIVAAFGVAPAAQAAEDYFLAFQTNSATGPPIEGEAQDAVFARQKAINVDSFDWSAANPVSVGSATGGAGTGKAKLNELTVLKPVDSASGALFTHLATGVHIPSMVLSVRRAGGTPTAAAVYLQYTFGAAYVTSVSPSGDGEQMRERVTFAYGSIRQSYWRQSATGALMTPALVTAWNQVSNSDVFDTRPIE
jgi:type VI secretion system secreted protein Hcp